jgi:hypothetical protein
MRPKASSASSIPRADVPRGPTTSESLAALHVARVKGLAALELLERVASPESIKKLEQDGLLRQTARGWALTPEGLERHTVGLAQEQASSDQDVIAVAHDRFLAVNASVKGVCAAWQRAEGDQEALWHTAELLTQYLGRVGPSLRQAGSILPRFEVYLHRLSAAAETATEGDARFVTDPAVDSFHNVWFECHEDYLLTLGRDREQEES